MNKRELQILRLLCKKTGWCTAAAISADIGCSIRSTKSYIANINSEQKELIASSRGGYQIADRERAAQLLGESNPAPPQDASERRTWILSKLLISRQNIGIEALANELCISYPTLEKELAAIKPNLAIYELSLKTKNDAVYLRGPEKNRRDMLIDLIYAEMPDSFAYSTLYQSFLPHADIGVIREIVNGTLLKCRYFIDDYSLMNAVLFLAVSIERGAAAQLPDDTAALTFPAQIPQHIAAIIASIREEIAAYFQVQLSAGDLQDLALLIMTRATARDLAGDADPKMEKLIAHIQERIRLIFGQELAENDNIARFSMHLRNMLVRLQNNVALKNPQLTFIKSSYPYIYEIAVGVAEVFTEETGFEVPEDEIGFLAIYIGIMLEEQKNLETKVKAALVCPKYFTMHTSLSNKLSSIFSDSMILTGVFSDPSELAAFDDYDFIISTIPFTPPAKRTLKFVSFQPDSAEIVAINEEIVRQRLLRMQQVFEQELSHLFIDDFYYFDPPLGGRSETIAFLADRLFERGYVAQDFKDKVFERERVCSSAILNIAMPHPLKNCSKHSAIAVAVLPAGIPWGASNRVNLVLMLSICEEDRLLFQDIFEFVTEFISDAGNLQSLLRAKSSAQFKQLISSFISAKLKH